jgi:hypothetical protein
LVQAEFDTVQRWSSHAAITWSGNTWASTPMVLDGLQVGALQIRGTLVLDNRDGAAGSLVLAQGVQDRVFRLWGFDAAATAAGDVVWLADAIGAGVSSVNRPLISSRLYLIPSWSHTATAAVCNSRVACSVIWAGAASGATSPWTHASALVVP